MTDQAIESVVDETLLAELPKDRGQVVRVRRLTVDGIELLDVRDYTPELEQYGRGILVPLSLKSGLLKAIKEA